MKFDNYELMSLLRPISKTYLKFNFLDGFREDEGKGGFCFSPILHASTQKFTTLSTNSHMPPLQTQLQYYSMAAYVVFFYFFI